MKVAVGMEHYDAEKGGAERYNTRFAAWLRQRGHHVDVYAAHQKGAGQGVSVWNPSSSGRRVDPIAFARWFRAAVSHADYDIIQAFNHVWPGDVLMLHGGVHLGFEASNAQSGLSAMDRFLKRLTYKAAQKYRRLRENERHQFSDAHCRFVAVSEKVAEDMRFYYPQSKDRIDVIYPGFDVARFLDAPRASVKKWPCSDLLFVSHNFRLKGLHILLKSLPSLIQNGWKGVLTVAGSGHPGFYERMAVRLGVHSHVHFVGGAADMRALYRNSTALVHPSFYDSFGGVCLEAMMFGMPVVMSHQCGVSRLVQNAAVQCINMPCTPEILAAAIQRACDPDFLARAADENQKTASQWTYERSFLALEQVYHMRKEER